MKGSGNAVALLAASGAAVVVVLIWLLWPAGDGGSDGDGLLPGTPEALGGPGTDPAPRAGARGVPEAPVAPLSAQPLPAALREERLPEERGSGAVTGSVVAAATKKAVPGARVSLHHPQGAFDLVAGTAEDGAFVIEGIPPVRGAWLRAAAAGFAPRWVREVDLGPGERIDVGAIELDTGPELRGRVVDPARRPIAGAQLLLLPAAMSRPFEDYDVAAILKEIFGESRAIDAVTSGDDGVFRFPCVGPGHYVVGARKKGLQVRYSDVLEIRSGRETSILELVLHAGRKLEGTVKDEAGAPVAGAVVAAMDQESAFTSGFKTEKRTTDVGGRFSFDTLGPAQLSLMVRARGFSAEARMIEARATEPVEIVLGRGARIFGRVFDRTTGQGIAGVPVMALSFGGEDGFAETVTDAEGQYVIVNAPAGKDINILVRAPGFTPEPGNPERESFLGGQHVALGEVPPGGDFRQDVPMLGGVSVSGRVIDAETGEGIARAEVRESRGGFFGGGGTGVSATTAADGSFTLTPLGAGKFTLQARKEGYFSDRDGRSVEIPAEAVANAGGTPVDPPPIEAVAAQRIEGQIVRLHQGLVVAGTVVDERGRPVAGAEVQGIPEKTEGRDPRFFALVRDDLVTSDGSGRFRVTGLPRRPVRVQAFHPDHPAGGETLIDLSAGVPEDLKVVLSKGASIAGEMLRPDNSAAAGYRIAFEPLDGKVVERQSFWSLRGRLEAETDGDGRFRLDGLPEGRGRITLAPWGQPPEAYVGDEAAGEQRVRWILESQGALVFLRSGEVTETRLLLREPLTLSGSVAHVDGTPVPGARLVVRDAGDVVLDSIEVRPDGSFEARGLAPGRYTLEVVVPGSDSQPRSDVFGPFDAGASAISLRCQAPK